MLELTILSKYPFLNDSRQYVKENNLSVMEILDDPLYERARAIGVERLDNSFKNRDVGNRSLASKSDCIMELLSYPIARMIAVCINDNYFKRSNAYRGGFSFFSSGWWVGLDLFADNDSQTIPMVTTKI